MFHVWVCLTAWQFRLFGIAANAGPFFKELEFLDRAGFRVLYMRGRTKLHG
jgi:hypothetical protein